MNFRRANLTGADLRGRDLTGADLRDACLHGADIRGVVLTGAKLRGIRLENCVYNGSISDMVHIVGRPKRSDGLWGEYTFGYRVGDGIHVRVGCIHAPIAHWRNRPDYEVYDMPAILKEIEENLP